MRIDDLFRAQPGEIQRQIGKHFPDNRTSYLFFYPERAAEICLELFKELPAETRQLYLETLEQKYALTEIEFDNIFKGQAKELRERALYLFESKSKFYLPPEEVVLALSKPDSLLGFLLQIGSTRTKALCPSPWKSFNKVRLIRAILQKPEVFFPFFWEGVDESEESKEKKRLEIIKAVAPIRPLLDIDFYSLQCLLEDVEQKLKFSLSVETSNSFGPPNFEKAIAQLKDHLPELFRNKIISYAIKNNGYTLRFILHPFARKVLTSVIMEERKQAREQLSNELKTISVAPESIYLHETEERLYRRLLFLAGSVKSGKIGFTQSQTLKAADLNALAAKTAPSKELRKTELALLQDLSRVCPFLIPQLSTEDRSIAIHQFLKMDRKHLLNIVQARFCGSELDKMFYNIPRGKWFSLKTLIEARRLSAEQEEQDPLENTFNKSSTDLVCFLLANLHRLYGLVDLSITSTPPGIAAARFVPEEQLTEYASHAETHSTTAAILPNFEWPIMPNLHPEKLIAAINLLSIKDINNLILDKQAIAHAQVKLRCPKVYTKALEELSGHELPANVKNFIDKHLLRIEPVVVNPGVVSIYCESVEQGKAVLKTFRRQIVGCINDKLFFLDSTGIEHDVCEKLEACGIPAEFLIDHENPEFPVVIRNGIRI